MSQLRFTISLAAAALSLGVAQAQIAAADSLGTSASPFGVSAAWELSVPLGSHGLWNTGSGAVITAHYALPIAEHWSFVPALGVYYSTMGTDFPYAYPAGGGATYDGTVKNAGIRLPLSIAYTFTPTEDVRVGIATGPWLNFNIFARNYAMPAPQAEVVMPRSINLFNTGFKRVEALWGLVLSVTFKEHYTVGITTGVGFTPLASFGNRDNKIRIRRYTVGLSLGYKF